MKPARIRSIEIADTHGNHILDWQVPQKRKFPPLWPRRPQARHVARRPQAVRSRRFPLAPLVLAVVALSWWALLA